MAIKPRNWRKYSGWYKRPAMSYPAQELARVNVGGGVGYRYAIAADHAYVAWLTRTRDMTVAEAWAYCDAMDRRKLISQHVFAGEPAVSPVTAKPADKPARKPASEAKPRSATVGAAQPVPRMVEPGLASRSLRAVIYARVSKDSSDADNQLHQLRVWCLSRGHELVDEYVDTESGGKSDKQRPELARMLADASAKRFDVVVVWALDRLSREGVYATITYLQRLADSGVAFASMMEPALSTDNELVRDIVIAVMAALGKAERVRISARTKAGLDRVRRVGSRSGLPIGRPALAPDKLATIVAMSGQHDKFAIASAIGCHWKTVAKYMPQAA